MTDGTDFAAYNAAYPIRMNPHRWCECPLPLDTPPNPGLPERAGLVPSTLAVKGARWECAECGKRWVGIGRFWKPARWWTAASRS